MPFVVPYHPSRTYTRIHACTVAKCTARVCIGCRHEKLWRDCRTQITVQVRLLLIAELNHDPGISPPPSPSLSFSLTPPRRSLWSYNCSAVHSHNYNKRIILSTICLHAKTAAFFPVMTFLLGYRELYTIKVSILSMITVDLHGTPIGTSWPVGVRLFSETDLGVCAVFWADFRPARMVPRFCKRTRTTPLITSTPSDSRNWEMIVLFDSRGDLNPMSL